MFAGLDDIAWERLEHAYGPASDVPGFIRDLVSRDEKVVDNAIYELFGNIYHQGTVYSASAPAVPFLAEALGSVAPRHQAALLALLGALAQGGPGFYDVHRHLPVVAKTIGDSSVDDADIAPSGEQPDVRETTLAVFAQWNAIEAYLGASDRRVRFAALFVLSLLGQNDDSEAAPPDEVAEYLGVRPTGHAKGHWANKIRRRADRALQAVKDPLERAAWLRALSQLGARDHVGLQLEEASSCSALEFYIVVWSCAVAELEKSPELPAQFAPLIADLVDRREELTEVAKLHIWPWSDAFEPGLLQLFTRLPEHALDDVAEACARLITEARSLVFYSDTILYLILGDTRPSIPKDPCLLSPGRREIARAFVANPAHGGQWGFWNEADGNAGATCAKFDVPRDRTDWLRWLEPSGQ